MHLTTVFLSGEFRKQAGEAVTYALRCRSIALPAVRCAGGLPRFEAGRCNLSRRMVGLLWGIVALAVATLRGLWRDVKRLAALPCVSGRSTRRRTPGEGPGQPTVRLCARDEFDKRGFPSAPGPRPAWVEYWFQPFKASPLENLAPGSLMGRSSGVGLVRWCGQNRCCIP
jgi:hypothetical protein